MRTRRSKTTPSARRLTRRVRADLGRAEVVIVSDYNYGVASGETAEALRGAAAGGSACSSIPAFA
jgi:hypothetical protein